MVNYIVSGFARSGTSMVMQILSKANMNIATDNQRESDSNNPKGYFEVTNIINKIIKNSNIVEEYDYKVLKLLNYGLRFLPKRDYKIVYIERDINEILDSSEKMIGKVDDNRDKTKNAVLKLNYDCKKLLKLRQDFNFIILNYKDFIEKPSKTIDKLISFFDIELDKKKAMISAVDKKLYRNKK
ncbi:nucleotide pyrophosphatase [Candidatus Woesearchaeota archaeon]|jgi:hypothetical protein|nr:nucleotide pyrophosphatase [Candidatus Woesearchaeota archaeon]|tara:strand:+ start:105 stop:656 length:552 start_codon:yes stop_codon:yes gene_type:complete